jgi:hypothetical protein
MFVLTAVSSINNGNRILTSEDFGERLQRAIARSVVRLAKTVDAVALPHYD